LASPHSPAVPSGTVQYRTHLDWIQILFVKWIRIQAGQSGSQKKLKYIFSFFYKKTRVWIEISDSALATNTACNNVIGPYCAVGYSVYDIFFRKW
jgi:hypothetical protein